METFESEFFNMTLTLYKRWKIRLFLLSTVGLFITWIYSDFCPRDYGVPPSIGLNPRLEYYFHWDCYWVLLYIGLLGIGWDIIYSCFQNFLIYLIERKSVRKVTKRFGVTISFVEKLLKQGRTTTYILPYPHARKPQPSLTTEVEVEAFKAFVAAYNNATLEQWNRDWLRKLALSTKLCYFELLFSKKTCLVRIPVFQVNKKSALMYDAHQKSVPGIAKADLA